MSTDRSRPTKYKYGDYVTHRPTGDPVLIDHADGNERDGVIYMAYHRGLLKPFFESELYPMQWRQFVWHRHPRKQRMMMGKTTGFLAVTIHLAGLIIAVLPWVGVESIAWSAFASAIGLSVIGLLWLKTWHNFTKRTV